MNREKILIMTLLLFFIATVCSGIAGAKSLYVIADINLDPTPIQAYDIQGNTLVYQDEYLVPYYGLGAVGIAIDTESEVLFITYEESNVIQLLDARTFDNLGTTTAPGASNLAGIVTDQDKGLIYIVDRYTPNLYIYEYNTTTYVLTLQNQIILQNCSESYGIALDEIHDLLYVADTWENYTLNDYEGMVHIYDTDTWVEIGNFKPSVPPISVAVDVTNNYVYTGNAWLGNGNQNLLCQYNLITHEENTTVIDPENSYIGVIGVAVDSATSLVYITTGYDGDDIRVFDSDLKQLFNTGYLGGDPTGLVIPGKEISFNPLNLSKSDGIEENDCVNAGDYINYTISFDNIGNEYDLHNVSLIDTLPAEVIFINASDNGSYNSSSHTVTWEFETIATREEYSVWLLVQVNTSVNLGSMIINTVTIDTDETGPTTQSETTMVCEEAVDQTPPVTIKIIGNPQYNDGEWVTPSTPITLTATDSGENASGVKEIHYKIDGVETIVSGDNVTFSFINDGIHTLEFWAVDNAGNIENSTIQTHYVDDTGPEQTFQFGQPRINDFIQHQGVWYTGVGANTPIWINSTDTGVGSKNLTYQLWIGEEYGEWVFEETITINDNEPGDLDPTGGRISILLYMDESCWHEIHYWCYDLLGNRAPKAPGSFLNKDFVV
ncbi:MAG: hypothetical protein QHH15_06340, partial [Candidatus Thermoplasmatota archaeon]|nr:hypothetical protein [Candidatus Thermoplasmatota archaeon]